MMRRMLALCVLILSAAVWSLAQEAQQPAPETAPALTPETLVEQIKGDETVTVEVETTEDNRTIVNLTVDIPYHPNLLRPARELALKYARAFFTQEDFPVDALHMVFQNKYAGKILEVHLGRDRIYQKLRRGVRVLLDFGKIENHVQFFMRIRDIETRGETPFDSVWYEAFLYPPDWPQHDMLKPPSGTDGG